jgi:UDP-N-acetylmuramoylalanine--D-glutamate ligase
VSGKAALRLLRVSGATELSLYDDNPGIGDYSDAAKLLSEFRPKTLVVSPGVPLSTPWIRSFEGAVTSELALAFDTLRGERLVCVSGSLGKSTTVSLLGAGAQAVDANAFLGGNLGIPLADYAAAVLEGSRPRAAWAVLELSSFQLENMGRLACEGAALTFLSPNHLERYASLEEYYGVKWALLDRASKAVALNLNGGDLADYAARHGCGPGSALTPKGVPLGWTSRETLPKGAVERMRLVGAHNADNLALAWSLASSLGWGERALDAMIAFRGLSHRLEALGYAGGLRFINDSKATSMESVLVAVSGALEAGGDVWLLLGGRDKKLPWEKLSELGRSPRIKTVFFGECGAHAQKLSGLAGPVAGKLADAVRVAKAGARSGDTVLLSPGGTSLDEFRNFEDRGRRFAEYVREVFGELS